MSRYVKGVRVIEKEDKLDKKKKKDKEKKK